MLSVLSRLRAPSLAGVVHRSHPFTPNFCLKKAVDVTRSVSQSTVGHIQEVSPKHTKAVGVWLMTCGGLTFVTVVVGGVTRLTNSGLSIVDWHPFKEFPPLSVSQWTQEFNKYKMFPEFKMYEMLSYVVANDVK